MSVKELRFITARNDIFVVTKAVDFIISTNGQATYLDRNQAHLLMLYLQEHLSKPIISKGLDEAISDELKDGPKSIMGNDK